MNDIRLSPHFKLMEFQCRCCGTVKLSALALEMLEALRELSGSPVVITSGYRCERHNRAVGGAPRSAHLSGMAADIYARPEDQEKLSVLAASAGFTEIIRGGKKNYIHVAIKKKL
jgi:uncharacterized protein YcbK (DUF882 family)